jgi:hypothetical protein
MTLRDAGNHPHDRRPDEADRIEGGEVIFPVRFDGEPVTDPMFALPLPVDFRPWEHIVAAYLADRTAELRRAA